MSNGFRWELSEWGDGTIRLAYWDAYGHDEIVVLNPDGSTVHVWDTYEGDEPTEHSQVVDLGLFLREWLTAKMKAEEE